MNYTVAFWNKVPIGAEGCWKWQGGRFNNGYGSAWAGKTVLAHRFAYENIYEPIPKGLQIDHLCRNKLCVRPDHLEAIPPRENLLRGNTNVAKGRKEGPCDNGHEGEWVYYMYPDGYTRRRCLACNRKHCLEYQARIKKTKHLREGGTWA